MEQGAFYKNFVQIRIQTQKFDYCDDNTTGANPRKSAIFLASNCPLYYAILSEKTGFPAFFGHSNKKNEPTTPPITHNCPKICIFYQIDSQRRERINIWFYGFRSPRIDWFL